MSRVELTIPKGVHKGMAALAKRAGIEADEMMVRTLAEKVESTMALEELRVRAKKGSLRHFRSILARVPDGPPAAGDELPAGFRMPRRKRRSR